MEAYLLIALFAGIVSMDTTSGPQFMISEPIVSCPVIGYILGMPETGLTMGIFFQLLWLGYLPLGTVHFIDSNMAAFISTVSLVTAKKFFVFDGVHSTAAFIAATLFGVAVGFIGMKATTYERKLNCDRFERLSFIEATGSGKLIRLHFKGIASAFTKGLILFLLLVPIGTILIGSVTLFKNLDPDKINFAEILIWGAVPASAILFFLSKGKSRYIATGVIGGLLSILL